MGRLFLVALSAGLVAAVTEMVFVLPIQHLLGNSPVVVFQGIAFGWLGKAAFKGGLSAALLGVGIHVFVSVVAAGLFAFAAQHLAFLRERPAASGMLYGIACYVVMTFIVIPLSAIGFHPPRSLFLAGLSLAIHIFAFGLPIALVANALMPRSALTPSPA